MPLKVEQNQSHISKTIVPTQITLTLFLLVLHIFKNILFENIIDNIVFEKCGNGYCIFKGGTAAYTEFKHHGRHHFDDPSEWRKGLNS